MFHRQKGIQADLGVVPAALTTDCAARIAKGSVGLWEAEPEVLYGRLNGPLNEFVICRQGFMAPSSLVLDKPHS
jgi:hypothetical protein